MIGKASKTHVPEEEDTGRNKRLKNDAEITEGFKLTRQAARILFTYQPSSLSGGSVVRTIAPTL